MIRARGKRRRLAAVARDALRQDGPVEARVLELVTRRELPVSGPRVERERCLKQVVTFLDDVRPSDDARSNHKVELLGAPEDFLAGGIELVLRLVDIGALPIGLEVPVSFLVEHANRRAYLGKLRGITRQRHGSSHAGLAELVVDILVARGALLRTHMADTRRGVPIHRLRIGCCGTSPIRCVTRGSQCEKEEREQQGRAGERRARAESKRVRHLSHGSVSSGETQSVAQTWGGWLAESGRAFRHFAAGFAWVLSATPIWRLASL